MTAAARGNDEAPHFVFGDLRVALTVVARLEDCVDAESSLRDADAPEPPYWLHVWTGGRALARHIAGVDGWRGKRVADLGCGLGLAGLVAARLGARVVCVDAVHDAVVTARENARANGCEVDAVQADLHALPLRPGFDAMLLADVTYDPALQRALAAHLATHLAVDGVGYCAESVRNHDPGFRLACERLGLRLEECEVREEEEGHVVPVRLAEVRRA